MNIKSIITVKIRFNARHRMTGSQKLLQDLAPLLLFTRSRSIIFPAKLFCPVLFLSRDIFIATGIGRRALHNVYNVHVLRFLAFSFPENLTIYSNVTILLNGNILPMNCIFISLHKSPFSIGIFQNSSRQYSIFHGKTQICKFTLACIYHIITMGL